MGWIWRLRLARPSAVWLCAALAFGVPTAVRAAEPVAAGVALKRAVVVHGDIVRLGDLFANLPETLAKLPAAYAPRAGQRATFDAQQLYEIAHAQGVAWTPNSRFDRVVVERASRIVGRDAIAALVRAALDRLGVDDRYQVVLDNDSIQLFVPDESATPIEVRNLRYDAGNRHFTAILVSDPNAPDSVTPVAGRVMRLVEVPVPARQISHDEVIGKDDLQFVKLDADRIDPTAITSASQLIGTSPRYMLRAGELVRRSEVRAPVLVQRDALVTIVFQTTYMVLTLRGKALKDGAKGETVDVQNPESKRVIQAVVSGPNLVTVPNGGPAMIN